MGRLAEFSLLPSGQRLTNFLRGQPCSSNGQERIPPCRILMSGMLVHVIKSDPPPFGHGWPYEVVICEFGTRIFQVPPPPRSIVVNCPSGCHSAVYNGGINYCHCTYSKSRIAGSQFDAMADDGQVECDMEVCDDDYVMVLPQDFGLQSPIVQQPPMFALEDVVISDDLNSVPPAPSSNKHLLPEDDDVPWQDFIEDKYLSDSSPDIGKGCVVIAPDDYGPVSKDIEGVGVCLAALEIQPSTMKRYDYICSRNDIIRPYC